VKRMWSEDNFNAAQNAFQWTGMIFQNVVQEIGLDRARELCIKPFEHYCQGRAKQITTALENNELDLKSIAAQDEMFWLTGGYDTKVEATPTSLITTTNKCPLYDGFLAAGIDHSTIEALCRGKDDAGDAQYKQLLGSHAGLKMRRFRSGSADYCIEE